MHLDKLRPVSFINPGLSGVTFEFAGPGGAEVLMRDWMGEEGSGLNFLKGAQSASVMRWKIACCVDGRWRFRSHQPATPGRLSHKRARRSNSSRST